MIKVKFQGRKIAALIAILALVGLIFPLQAFATPSTVHLTIHYQRPADDYKGWNVWLWKNVSGTTGDVDVSPTGSEFNGSDAFGKILTIDIPNMDSFENVGFIMRLNNWVAKDVSDDRFITKFDANGNAEIWLVQADPQIHLTLPTSVAAIRSAMIDGFRQITLELSQKATLSGVGNEGFAVSDGLEVSSVTSLNGSSAGATKVVLNLSSDIVLGKTYTITNSKFGSVQTKAGQIMSSSSFSDRFTYAGDDLGSTYSTDHTNFRVWAPTASAVSLVSYATANAPATSGSMTPMTPDISGTWVVSKKGDLNGSVYTYRVTVGGVDSEAVDPYVRAVTINGERGVVVNLAQTDPKVWTTSKPFFSGKGTDALIYELHIRDLSMDASSNIPIAHKGKFLALADVNTVDATGAKTGVNAIKDLGVTHVELLPVFDYASVDESNPTFNWGYDPQNYNVPEGSYSTDPINPKIRILEFKTAIQALHDQKLRVMMDVVYNHVFSVSNFSEEKIVPGYFFRTNSDGSLTNGSGVGNDMASERPMARKFIVDSVKYWAKQYHIDGFRFDLMGLLDIETMQQIRKELNKIDPTILIIGEGWNMGTLDATLRANQQNIGSLTGISAFNDQLRDGVKGSVFNVGEAGYATGNFGQIGNTKVGIIGNVFYSKDVLGNWITANPTQSVNYVESHDNLTLADKIVASVPGASADTIATLDRLSASIPLLAQGVPFIQAGQEFLRSKKGDANSYKSDDSVNSLKWNLRSENAVTVDYYKGLISLRAAHPAFRMSTTAEIQKNFRFLPASKNVISYLINGAAVKDSWKSIFVAHNPNATAVVMTLPTKGDWHVFVKGTKAGTRILSIMKGVSKVSVDARSTLVMEK